MKFTLLLMAFFAAKAQACPDLTGKYSCEENGTVYELEIVWDEAAQNMNLGGQQLTPDDKSYPISVKDLSPTLSPGMKDLVFKDVQFQTSCDRSTLYTEFSAIGVNGSEPEVQVTRRKSFYKFANMLTYELEAISTGGGRRAYNRDIYYCTTISLPPEEEAAPVATAPMTSLPIAPPPMTPSSVPPPPAP